MSIKNITKRISNNFVLSLIAMVLIVTPCLYFYYFYNQSFNTVIININTHAWIFRFIRWSVLGLFIALLPLLMDVFGKRFNVSGETITSWKAEIFRIAMWLIILELILGENIGSKLLS